MNPFDESPFAYIRFHSFSSRLYELSEVKFKKGVFDRWLNKKEQGPLKKSSIVHLHMEKRTGNNHPINGSVALDRKNEAMLLEETTYENVCHEHNDKDNSKTGIFRYFIKNFICKLYMQIDFSIPIIRN